MYPKGNIFVPASHGRLEAILKEPPEGQVKEVALVCHPHPLGGGTMHNKVVYRAAAGLVDAGLATLRFNFRGVGLSTGSHDDGRGELEDIRAVLDYLSKQYPGARVTLAGFSFGSYTGSQVAIDDERIVRLISIGTPVDKYDFSHMEKLRIPLLFLHGDSDEFGSVDAVSELVAAVGENTDASLVIFEKCGHFFEGQLPKVRIAVHDWVREKMAENIGSAVV